MRQVLQSLRTGEITLAELPVPAASDGSLVVESRATVLSPGTERMLVEFGRANLLEKARQQPEKVRQVLGKVRRDGLRSTVEAVRSKLDEPVALGYCQAGVVRAVGSDVRDFAIGDRVVTNGGHAEYVRVPRTLAARIPSDVTFEAAAFTPLAAIGLQGLRLAQPTLGENVVVYGLGVIGLLTVQLARAHGCRVIGIDRIADRLALAESFGAEPVESREGDDLAAKVHVATGGVGADAVLLTLASESDDPVHQAAQMSRKRGRLVLVGVTGLDLQRSDFYEKELSLQVSCSYGPGRYDPTHEEGATDYPLPYVRWTEGRNFEAVLGLIADGRLDPAALVTRRISFDRAPEAYEAITGEDRALGVLLEYPEKEAGQAEAGRTVSAGREGAAPGGGARQAEGVVGFIGAGNFATRVLMPAFAEAGASLHTVVSSTGRSAARAAEDHGFERVTTDPDVVFEDPSIDTVVIATRHDSHAEYVVKALDAGKHVFVEKPLAIRLEEIDAIEEALARSDRILCVGFNRRFAPLTVEARRVLEGRQGPLVVSITVHAGSLPDDHWTKDPEIGGGRLVGEACHFIDLARCLVGTPIRDVTTTSARDPAGRLIEDVSVIQMTFDDGSIATIQYLANSPEQLPKERVELFWEGRGIRIDDWRGIEGGGVKGTWFWRSRDKGHTYLAFAFLRSVTNHAPPAISRRELLEVSRCAIQVKGE